MTYTSYADWSEAIFDAVLNRIRMDKVTGNYGFKAFELLGDRRFPEVVGMPLVRLIPDPDNIQRLETCTRNHFMECEVRVFDHKPDEGEQGYRDHRKIAGAVYDIFSRRDTEDPTLGGLVEEMQIRRVDTKLFNGAEGVMYVSALPMSILAVKEDE